MVAVALLIASCQPSAGPGPDGRTAGVDPADPCSLLSPAQIASVATIEVSSERQVQSRADPQDDSVPLCMYATQPFNSLTLHLESPVSERDFLPRLRRDPLNTKEIEGVGDMAFLHAGASIQTLSNEMVRPQRSVVHHSRSRGTRSRRCRQARRLGTSRSFSVAPSQSAIRLPGQLPSSALPARARSAAERERARAAIGQGAKRYRSRLDPDAPCARRTAAVGGGGSVVLASGEVRHPIRYAR